ncbi:MAG: RNA polymerase sigma factor [Gammaproteobacteria bacterium]
MSAFPDRDVDAAILAGARAGDRAAHAALYEAFGDPVYTLALRILQSPAAADEALQDTFVEVIRRIDSFDGRGPCGAWIRRIAVNKCLMQLRSSWRRQARPLDDPDRLPGSAAQQTGDSVQLRLDLDKALGQLSERARAVLWLHDVEGYTHREIGRLTGKSTSYSKSQLARAHTRLKALLGEPKEAWTCMHALTSC